MYHIYCSYYKLYIGIPVSQYNIYIVIINFGDRMNLPTVPYYIYQWLIVSTNNQYYRYLYAGHHLHALYTVYIIVKQFFASTFCEWACGRKNKIAIQVERDRKHKSHRIKIVKCHTISTSLYT